jgi:hypothetical protein
MRDRQATLFANDAFYQAFSDGDFAAMDALWAHDAQVACIHPGWEPLSGRDSVMESWRAILGSENRPAINNHAAKVHLYGAVAFVICYEEVNNDFLVATNVFVQENGTWKMVHHQAGPTAPPMLDDPEEEPGLDVLH